MTDSGKEIDDDERARSLARSLLADIALHNREDLRAGRDMKSVFDETRMQFAARVTQRLHPLFDQELAAFVARDEARPARPSEDREQRRAIFAASATAAVVVVLFVAMWASTRTDGDEVGTVPIPGTKTIRVTRGDRLRFEADHDVYFAADGAEDEPDGCTLEIAMKKNAREIARSHCDLFHTSGAAVLEDGENEEEGEDGLTHLEVFEVHLGCSFQIAEDGEVTLALTSNLDTCVPRRGRSTVHVFRSRGH